MIWLYWSVSLVVLLLLKHKKSQNIKKIILKICYFLCSSHCWCFIFFFVLFLFFVFYRFFNNLYCKVSVPPVTCYIFHQQLHWPLHKDTIPASQRASFCLDLFNDDDYYFSFFLGSHHAYECIHTRLRVVFRSVASKMTCWDFS